MYKLGYLSTTGTELKLLSDAYKNYLEEDENLILKSFSSKDYPLEKDRLEFLSFIEDVDMLLVSFHGGAEKCLAFSEALENLKSNAKICIFPSSTDIDLEDALKYSNIEKDHWKELVSYYNYSGEENLLNLLKYVISNFSQVKLEYDLPKELPWEGIYYPDIGYMAELDEYLEKVYVEGNMTLGLSFHRSQWTSNNVDFIRDIVEVAKKKDLNIIPVFTNAIAVGSLGNLGAGKTFEKYFMKDGESIIDAGISLMMFSNTMNGKYNEDMFEMLNVPIVKGILSFNEKELWEETYQGLNPIDISISIAMPEFDGHLISVPVAFSDRNNIDPVTGARISKYVSELERIEKLLSITANWARLSHIKNEDKKVAILFHNYPPKNHSIGTAFGLDSPVSVINIMKEMKFRGYKIGEIPSTGDELIGQILEHATNDRNFISEEELFKKAVDSVDKNLYEQWFNKLSYGVKEHMIKAYGSIPGEMFNYDDSLIIPGLINENVFIGIQPPRGTLEDADKVHDQDLPMPHHYYAYYEWIRNVFSADVVVHVGMHGSLEWLPGKSAGLSKDCYPDMAIGDLPNIYPYIINNPGEGTQAKRRSYACIIDHLIPIMHNADTYDETAEIENLFLEYYDAEQLNPSKIPDIEDMIWVKVLEANLHKDLKMGEIKPIDFPEFIEILHDYINELSDTQIRNGLHTFGIVPKDEKLVEFLVALTRLENAEIPSLRRSIAKAMDYDLDELLDKRGKRNSKGEINAYVINRIHSTSLDMMREYFKVDFDKGQARRITNEFINFEDPNVVRVLEYIGSTLVPNLNRTVDEVTNTVNAMEGKYVSPGPSGSPTRGMAHILPTGRNFYSVNPKAIPSQAAWKVGKNLGDDLIDRYMKEEGTYPENVAILVGGSCIMRTKGDDIAEILYLLGLRPIWEKASGNVDGLEIIPLNELKRPRIDVTMRITGFFRDSFPNLVELLDEAVKLVAFLDEADEDNYIAKNVRMDMADMIKSGLDAEIARDEASSRIFGCIPGGYGAGVSELVNSKYWDNLDDLGNAYLEWSSYSYGKGKYGQSKPNLLKKRLSVTDIAVSNVDHRERGLLDSDDFYSYHGGLIAAVRTFKGSAPKSFIGDSSEVERVTTRTVDEEIRREFRARVFNPKWIESMKEHGYKGAGDIANTINHAFGWDATVDAVDDWIYEDIAKVFLFDEKNGDWMREVNPWARNEIAERLLEAIQRDMWDASDEMADEIKKIYIETEGDIEGYGD